MLKKVLSKKNHLGYALLLMLLLIIVIGGLIWLDPTAFFRSSDPNLPWNEEFRLVAKDKEVPPTTQAQPVIEDNLLLKSSLKKEDESRGSIGFVIKPDGRIEGSWAGEFHPEKKVLYELISGGFEGNIAPSKKFIDENGIEDPSKLYFFTKGGYFILVTDDNTGKVYKMTGDIYVRGWINPDYHATGEMIVTADKKTYKSFSWEGNLEKMGTLLDLPGFPGISRQ
jgi:hypothetical protein